MERMSDERLAGLNNHALGRMQCAELADLAVDLLAALKAERAEVERLRAESAALQKLKNIYHGCLPTEDELDRYEAAEALLDEMGEAMQEFVDRCDRGEVRSNYTYGKFKAILAKRERSK